MVRLLPVALAAVLALTVLAGCSSPPAKDDAARPEDAFVRRITADLTQADLEAVNGPADVLALFHTTFTFTAPDAVDVQGTTVAYTDASGAAQTVPLSSFTPKASLAKGASITITGTAVTSDVVIRHGDAVVAQRLGAHPQWLTAEGAPLPLAAKAGAVADYTFSSTANVGLSFDRAGYQPSDGKGDKITDFTLDGGLAHNGTLALAAVQAGPNLRVTLDAQDSGQGHLKASGKMDSNGNAGDFAFDGTIAGHAKGNVGLLFNSKGELTKAGAGGSIFADGTAKLGVFGPANHEMPGVTHPFIDATAPYTDSDAPSGDPAPANIVALLESLYSITFVPGDTIHVGLSFTSPQFGGSANYDLTVAARTHQDVAGSSRSVLKLVGTLAGSVTLEGKNEELKAVTFTYYVDEASMLPFSMDGSVAQTYGRADVGSLLEALQQQDAAFIFPDALSLETKGTFHLGLTQVHDGFTAPAIGQAYALAAPVIVAAAVVFVLVTKLSGNDASQSENAAVTVSSNTASTLRLTLIAGGQNSPYCITPVGGCPTPDARITVDGRVCRMDAVDGGTPGYASLADTNQDGRWAPGEAFTIKPGADGCLETASAASGTTHVVTVVIHGTVVQDNTPVVLR